MLLLLINGLAIINSSACWKGNTDFGVVKKLAEVLCGAALAFSTSWKQICSSIVCPGPYYSATNWRQKMRQHSIFQCVAVRAWQTLSQMFLKRCKMCFIAITFCSSSQVVASRPASKCRSFGKTESWAWRIITVHFSNWAEAKQFQNLSGDKMTTK